VGTGEGYSVLQVVETARKITGHSIPVKIMDGRPGDPPRLVAKENKLRNELGWKPKYDKLADIVGSAWAWHQAHPEGYPD
jgi:UDP-glucose 4-epimerase